MSQRVVWVVESKPNYTSEDFMPQELRFYFSKEDCDSKVLHYKGIYPSYDFRATAYVAKESAQ